MYVLAISGSPRKGGNTEVLLKAVLAELEKTGWRTALEKVGATAIRGCTACGAAPLTASNPGHRAI